MKAPCLRDYDDYAESFEVRLKQTFLSSNILNRIGFCLKLAASACYAPEIVDKQRDSMRHFADASTMHYIIFRRRSRAGAIPWRFSQFRLPPANEEIDKLSFMSWSRKSDKCWNGVEKFIHNVEHDLISTSGSSRGKRKIEEAATSHPSRFACAMEFNDF